MYKNQRKNANNLYVNPELKSEYAQACLRISVVQAMIIRELTPEMFAYMHRIDEIKFINFLDTNDFLEIREMNSIYDFTTGIAHVEDRFRGDLRKPENPILVYNSYLRIVQTKLDAFVKREAIKKYERKIGIEEYNMSKIA